MEANVLETEHAALDVVVRSLFILGGDISGKAQIARHVGLGPKSLSGLTQGRYRYYAAKQPNKHRARRCAQSTQMLAIWNYVVLNSVSSSPLCPSEPCQDHDRRVLHATRDRPHFCTIGAVLRQT